MLYKNIEDPPPSVNEDWDITIWQPDLVIPDSGAYDALAMTSKVEEAFLGEPFTMNFVWLRSGAPEPQPFEIYDPTLKSWTKPVANR